MVLIEAMLKPQIMGFRYPHRVSAKLVSAAAAIPPTDLGVKIIPLPSGENSYTETAYSGMKEKTPKEVMPISRLNRLAARKGLDSRSVVSRMG